MPLSVYEASVGLFIHGLTNLQNLLLKAEAHIAANGGSDAALLGARLAAQAHGMESHPNDVQAYTLAAQIHWAAEGAKLAVAHLLGTPAVPNASDEESFADLYRHLDATTEYLREITPSELEANLDREVVLELGRGSLRLSASQFLLEYAIPHFYVHATAAYGILRNQGMQLTMGDFLGNFARADMGR